MTLSTSFDSIRFANVVAESIEAFDCVKTATTS